MYDIEVGTWQSREDAPFIVLVMLPIYDCTKFYYKFMLY